MRKWPQPACGALCRVSNFIPSADRGLGRWGENAVWEGACHPSLASGDITLGAILRQSESHALILDAVREPLLILSGYIRPYADVERKPLSAEALRSELI